MALLTCEECGGKVSSKASHCPHCGIPILSENKPYGIYTVRYDGEVMNCAQVIAAMYNKSPNVKRKIWDMCNEVGVAEDDLTIGGFIDQIYSIFTQQYGYEAERVELLIPPSEALLAQIAFEEKQHEKMLPVQHIPKCPTCGSTDLLKKSAASRALDGFVFGRLSVEGRSQWQCKNCGYMW